MSLLGYNDFIRLNEGYGYQLKSDEEIAKMEDINILYQFIKNYIQKKGLNIPQPITISDNGNVKIIRTLDIPDFIMNINREFNFVPSTATKKIKIGRGFNVSFGNGTRVAGGTPKGPEFEDHFVSDMVKWIELGDEAYRTMYNPDIVQEFISKSNFYNEKNITMDSVQKVGGKNARRPLIFNGAQPYIGSLNFEQIGETLSDVTISGQKPYYVSCKTTPTVTFFNAGIQKLVSPTMIDNGEYSKDAIALFNMLGIEPDKFTKAFRFRKKLNVIVNELEELEDTVRDNLGIDSAEPIYQDAKIRKKWMEELKKGVEEIGVAEIKAKWNKVFDALRNDGYDILSLFLGLSVKVNKEFVAQYERRVIDRDTSSTNAAVFKDFLNVNIVESEEKFAEKIEVNIDNKILNNFVKSGIGMNYWLVHKGYKGNQNSVKFVDASFLEEASSVSGPVTVYYGGKTGNAVKVSVVFESKLFKFDINIRDKEGKTGYPTHIMMDYTYK